MRKIIIGIIVLGLLSCNRDASDGYTKVDVVEVIEVASYTYLLVKEKKSEYWIATATMTAEPGESYKYRGGILMSDFHSEELDRTFDEVLFIDQLLPLSDQGTEGMNQAMQDPHQGMHGDQDATPGSSVTEERSDIKVEAVEGTITIEDLFSDLKAYKGKTVRVRAKVTKFNPAIMERNWVHLQDGTEYEGNYDLTATTTEPFEVGSIVILEGKVALDLDFGYGYTYEVLLEKAKAVE